jgi:hypothetical protein
VTVRATDAIVITGRDSQGFRSGLFSNAVGEGDDAGHAGALIIAAPVLQMDEGRIAARTAGDGNAGDIEVRVDRLALTGGAQIFNGTGNLVFIDGEPSFEGTGGPGQGGDLTVTAEESIVITGHDPANASIKSGLFSNAQFGSGRAGNLFVSTPRLDMQGGLILASSERTSRGDAGNLTMEVGTLILTAGAEIDSSSRGVGLGGTVRITATESVALSGRDTGLFTRAAGSGAGGDIILQARNAQLH